MSTAPLVFWLAVAAMVGVALAFVLPRLLGREPRSRGASRAALNARLYRAELDEIARERACGALSGADYASARAELERRLLDDVAADERPASAVRTRGAAAVVAIALPALAVGLYLLFGTPAAVRPAALAGDAAPAAQGADFRAQLVAHLASAPRDARAWVALARLDMGDDRFDDAAAHFAKAIAASDKVARDPGVLCEYADALGMAQGGRLGGRPAELVERALALDPSHPVALEMAGSAAYERGDFRAAARHWRTLLARLDGDSPAHVELAAAVERAERLAATSLPPPDASARGG